ncbi:MAG: D-mannonate epimerase [Verrucomicrobiota bacterium]
MSMIFERGGADVEISSAELDEAVFAALDALGDRRRVMAVPPDFTRFNSRAGDITGAVYRYYGERLTDIMPALGTHAPMSAAQLDRMYPDIPRDLFRVHDWRKDVITAGEVPAEYVREATEGIYYKPWPCQINRHIWEGGHDLVLSIGQVVPHEVVGMANHAKNLFVGTGGSKGINESHFIGAAYGMERMMGRADTPLRRIFNYGMEHFAKNLPVVFFLTVIGPDAAGKNVLRGLYVGEGDDECFRKAAALARQVNVTLLDEPVDRAVVFLDEDEFQSTWLGNKAIYRTRMALADDAELTIIAPGVREFGEDREIDALIRRYGYRTTPEIMQFVKDNPDLAGNLSAAAHLIHGSSEGRFKVTYCPGHLSREEVESVGYEYGDVHAMTERYLAEDRQTGWATLPDGERFFYISNPALGLWAAKEKFGEG